MGKLPERFAGITLLNRPILVIFLTVLNATAAAYASPCTISKGPDSIQPYVDFLKCEQNSPPTFPNYKISDFPIVLVDMKDSPSTGAIVVGGQVRGNFKLDSPVSILNGLYEYQNSENQYQNRNPALASILEKWGVKQAMIWNVSADFVPTDNPLRSWGNSVYFSILAHEGLHFFGQNLKRVPTQWPSDSTSLAAKARDQMQDLCFNKNDQVKKLVSSEREAILAAFSAAHAGEKKLAHQKAKDFLRIRAERYKVLDGVKIPFATGDLSCESAENHGAFAEGIPEYVGIGTIINLGLISANQALDYFPADDSAFWYRFPLFQALIMTDGGTVSILEPFQSPEAGVAGAFKHWVQIMEQK